MANHSKLEDYSLPLAVIVGAIIIAGAVIYSSGPGGSTTNDVAVQPSPSGAPQAPSVAVDSKNIKVAGPYIGQPNAKLTIGYWFDYQCPFCQRAEQTILQKLITEYVDTGKAKLVIKDFQFLGPDSQTLGLTARAVWQVAPSKFYDWFKAIFDKQGRENSGWATTEMIRSITLPVLGKTDTDKVMALAISNEKAFTAAMTADKTEGGQFGVQSTPSFVIGKSLVVGARPYEDIKASIETALK